MVKTNRDIEIKLVKVFIDKSGSLLSINTLTNEKAGCFFHGDDTEPVRGRRPGTPVIE